MKVWNPSETKVMKLKAARVRGLSWKLAGRHAGVSGKNLHRLVKWLKEEEEGEARWSVRQTNLDALWAVNRSRRRLAVLLQARQPISLMPPHAFTRASAAR